MDAHMGVGPRTPRGSRPASAFSSHGVRHRMHHPIQVIALIATLFLVYSFVGIRTAPALATDATAGTRALANADRAGPILVSYAYFEKDAIQRDNFDYFMTIAMGLDNRMYKPQDIDFVIVQSGATCSPCARLEPMLRRATTLAPGVTEAFEAPGVTLLRRAVNEGMDFASHNTTLTHLLTRAQLSRYRYVFFLNSSIRGPFVPSYLPHGWQWTDTFLSLLNDRVHVVSSSLVCLPEVDAGGYGPKLESWAFAADRDGLDALLQEDLFQVRQCKLCNEGVVVKGEYGITEAILKHGMQFDTLMARYKGVDWSDKRNWRCNDNVHPSRHGTYGGITMHPFETVFIKASWHVGSPFVEAYTRWFLAQAAGESPALGSFDEKLYHYAVSERAQQDHHVEQCYKVLDDQGNAL